MARKLAFDYTFNKAARQITLNGNVNPKRLLLINNATANTVIYNVGDPALRATSTVYSDVSDTTTITLNYDTTGMNNSDVLQIYTEQDGVEIKPVDTLLDPVSKFRVSEPNTLIDTDFEYGLQATKWETLERVNNIPGYYSISGDTPLSNIADVTTNGSKIVTVTTTSPHGLTTGIPIDVRGLDSVTAEGTFLVRKTTDYTFTYETRTVQPGSLSVPVSINTAYVTITTGRFYVQAQVPFDNSSSVDEGPVVTDGLSPSTLTVTTPYKHGFKVGSPFYLTNTLSNKRISFNPAAITASGNVEDRTVYTMNTGNFNPYEPVHAGTSLRVVEATSAISTTNNWIVIPNHGLLTGDPITYLGSTGAHPGTTGGGGTVTINNGQFPVWNTGTAANATNPAHASSFLFVSVLDADTFRIHTNPKDAYAGTNVLTINAVGSGTLTFSLFNSRGYELQQNISKIETVNGQNEIRVTLGSRTNKQMGIYPERQITLSNTGIPGLDGSYVVMGALAGVNAPTYYSTQRYRETDNFFIMQGPTNASANLVSQTVTATYTLSNTAAAPNVILTTKNYENTFSPTISSVSGATITVPSMSRLGDGDLPTRVGSIVRFTNVGSLTGVAVNTDYYISALSATSITLSSTNPAISTTAINFGGTVGAATIKVFRSGIRAQVHDAASSWLNHTRASVHDWAAINAKMFTRECINANRIYIKNHGLVDGVPVLLVGGGNTWTGGAQAPNMDAIYYVSKTNNDEFELRTTETFSGTGPYGSTGATVVTFTTANTWAGGVYQIHPGFTVNDFTASTGGTGGGRDRVLGRYTNLPSYMTEKAEIVLVQGTGSTLPNTLSNTPNTYSSYQKYYARTLVNSGPILTASEFSVSLAENSTPINFGSTATSGAGKFLCIRIAENAYSNSFYIPNHGGVSGARTNYNVAGSFSTTTAQNGTAGTGSIDSAGTNQSTAGGIGPLFDYVTDITGVNWPRVYMTLTQTTALQGLTSGNRYYMVPITDDIFKVQLYSASVLPTGQPTVQLSLTGTASQATTSVSGPFGTNTISFGNTSVSNQFGNRIFLPIEQQSLVEGDIVRYESTGTAEVGSAYTGAPGLVNGNLFTVRNVSDFTPLSTGLSTSVDHDSDATIITLDTNVGTLLSAGNTVWSGTYLNERMLVNAVGAGTFTINGQSVTLLANQIHVTRAYAGTTAKPINANVILYRVNGSFQLHVRESATPRSFSVAGVAAQSSNDYWDLTAHGLRIGETVAISQFATGAGITNIFLNGAAQTQSANAQLYYAIPINNDRFQLAHSRAAAFAGFPLDITGSISNTQGWNFVQYYDSVPLASTGAGGTLHYLTNVSSTGTIDGGYDASTVTDSKMTFSPASTTITPRSIVFNPVKNVDLKTGTFIYQDHGLTTGTRVTYARRVGTQTLAFEIGRGGSGGTMPREGYNALFDIAIQSISTTGTQVTYNFATLPSSPFDIVPNQSITISGVTVGGLTNNGYNGTFKVVSSTVQSVTVANTTTGGTPLTTNAFVSGSYYVIRKNLDMFQLAYTKEDALAGRAIQNYSTTGTAGGHMLTTNQVTGESLGNGLATIVARDIILNGSSTAAVLAASDRFVSSGHGFNTGDRVVYQVWGNGRQINGLVSGRQYFVNNTETSAARGGAANGQKANQFSLHNTWVGAYTNTDLVDILGVGTSTLHQFKVTNPTLKGTTFKGDWNTSDTYSYGDVVLYRNNYYMSVIGAIAPGQKTFVGNTGNAPVADASGRANINWMLLPPLPSYSTKFLAQYRGGDTVKLSGKMSVKTVPFNGTTAVNFTTFVFTVANHGLQTGDTVIYKTDAQGGWHQGSNGDWQEYTSQLPQQPYAGIFANQIYYVNVISTSEFTLHDTISGAMIGGSTAGSGIDQVQVTGVGTGTLGAGQSGHRLERLEGYVFDMNVIAVNNDADMIVTDPYPTRQLTFNPQSTVNAVSGPAFPVISIERDEIYIPNHGLNTGVKVYYSAGFGIGQIIGTNPANTISEGGTYYVIKVNDDTIRLATTLSNALKLQCIDINSTGQGFNHYLVAATYCGSSYLRYQHSSGDLASDSLTGANAHLYASQTSANIRDGVLQALPFIYETQMFVRPDCLNLHRSFDGGVEISAARAPGVQITRQTRRYFRYQSGKGLQYSTGINFSPSIDVAYITHDGSYATVTTRKPHKLQAGNKIILEDVLRANGTEVTEYTTPSPATLAAQGGYPWFSVFDVIDEFKFRYVTNGIPAAGEDRSPAGFPALFVHEWVESRVRAGMFDDQNGMFFEYDGQDLFCVRRNATAQTAGTISVAFKSNAVVGSDTRFTKQLKVGDRVVIRGMTYKVTAVDSDTSIHISPGYRGTTRSKIIMTKVQDLRVGRTSGTYLNNTLINSKTWNIDKCDGNGVTGFKLDIHRQQMAYMDYSWYGAGKVRFGFKDQDGIVTYVHEFVHNNKENEAYLRSGNLPARYDIENGPFGESSTQPTYAPSLYHWGASVIMDGKFEDDKAYLFTVASGSQGSDTVIVPGTLSGTAVPILSIRLAPSVDTSLVGPVGERDLINRMILKMDSCGIVCTPRVVNNSDVEQSVSPARTDATSVRLILNGNLSQSAYFTNYGAPSLCQIIKHTGQSTDTVTGGVSIFEFRAAAGAGATQPLTELVEMGNSILGGDYVFPNGPDVLTLAVVTTIPNTIGANFGQTQVTARLTWTESQA